MATIAAGSFQNLVTKAQSALGTKATASGAQRYSFLSADINLGKDNFVSNEIRPSMQIANAGHGGKTVDGTIGVELGAGGYTDLISAVFRSTWAAVSPYNAGTDVTAAATSPHFVDASGGFLTAGLKIGMIVRWTGFVGAGATDNNSRNFLITALTATNMSGVFLDDTAVTADVAGDDTTVTPVGKFISIPQSAHTRVYHTIELDQSDITQAEQHLDCAITSLDLAISPSEYITGTFGIMGLNTDYSTAAYFTSPTAIPSGGKLNVLKGGIFVNGTEVGVIQDTSLAINGSFTRPGAVTGSKLQPDTLPGTIVITGSMKLLFQDAAMRDLFEDETESVVVITASTSDSATADTFTITMSRVLFDSFEKTRSGNDVTAEVSFRAIEHISGGTGTAYNATSITFQDSAVA